ncbi:TonB-dependent receptor domain-containing protein [Allosphingosinicella deserti]|uniref:TonB-dependent receptor n=1 Tax=Allosphingosinicella deserti TaxID=2116704 RepID=A0A2P7QPW8_9SPHN|nr:TonB-dependent receptor [Sphingomonas deserti]PSJ40012.1 TonB-dependent receptor [Sphingomonas deserti]
MARLTRNTFARTVSAGALIIGGLSSAPAFSQAQQEPTAAPLTDAETAQGDTAAIGAPFKETGVSTGEPLNSTASRDEIVVTGFRASLENALNVKRRSNQIVDAITAEDIADFPDANLAESIQRLPGISIDRENGEGRSITVRGLGGDFQMVRLNGADAQAVAGGISSDAGANRTRGFDFNTFASELFGGIKVTKSTSASNDEGSLGAIIDLTTGRPLSFKTDRVALGLEGEYRENGGTVNPRLTALFSKRFSDSFGILGSFAYQDQKQQIDAYRRSIGNFEYAYRNSQIPGVTPPTFGFARPSTAGTGATFGSDPAAYALIAPTTIIPTLPSIGRQDLSYDRLGATLTMQWKPSSRTEIVLDGVYSRYRQESTVNAITTIGLNRNFPTTSTAANPRFTQGTIRPLRNANGSLNANGVTDRIGTATATGLFQACRPSATVECGQSIYGNTLVPGTINSYNPNNLDPFDYYNSPVSPGFIPSTDQLAGFVPLLGRTNTKLRQAHVNEVGQADYLLLDDVDWRSSADAQFGNTQFKQGTLNVTQEFTDRFRAEGTLGWSSSKFRATGLLADFNTLDRDGYTFDEREGGIMPVFSPGFDVADPNQWTLVKGLSTIRYFNTRVSNEFKVGRLNFAWDFNDAFTLRFGGTYKQFNYEADQGRREQDIEAINPTLQEAGLKITDLGRLLSFGQGLTVSEGTPTSFYAPDLNAFRRYFQIDCNCVNKWGDYRAIIDGRESNAVTEKDLSGFVQVDFDTVLFGRPLRGDVGVRVARTRVTGEGNVGGGRSAVGVAVVAHNQYTDVLPSTNIVYEPVRDFLIRAAVSKTISRPQLSALTPGTTSFPTSLNNTTAPVVTVGNPYLSPFRSTNFDVSFERYFGRSGLIGLSLFYKDLKSFPQQIALEAPLSDVFEPALLEQVIGTITNVPLRDYTRDGGVYAVRQFRDAPGGSIKGIEVNVQTNFDFIGEAFRDFGITANYTHIESKLNYLTSTVLNTTRTGPSTAENTFDTGPFLNTSPDSFNATFYYENKTWSARVSGAYRKRYVNRFPLSSGTCAVGTTTQGGGPCNSPVFADFGYTENTLNIDAAFAWNVNDILKLTIEGRNLTNEPQYRTMYEDNPVTQTYASTGRIITAGVRMIF